MTDREKAIEILQRIADDKTEELHICDDEGGSVCGLILEEQNAILAGIEALKEQRPHGECRDRLKEVFREASEIGGDLFHLSQIERIIDGEDWL